MNRSPTHDVAIVGAGLAGLACAKVLSRSGRSVVVLEASERVGGRVRTDHVDGFLLDHGFQVLLTAYPACREWLDYAALELRPFQPGALVRSGGKFALLADPWRTPSLAITTALSPIGSMLDKLRIARLRFQSRRGSLADLYERDQQPTRDRLRSMGFSESMITSFFEPFLGGVFLDESLATPSRMMEFVMRMFAEGDIAVPAAGMAAIPQQLASSLPEGSVRLRTTATKVEPNRVTLSDGSEVMARRVVVATESDAAARLLNRPALATAWSGTTTMYFATESVVRARAMLMLRGDESGPIQTATVISQVAPEYAPAGKSLISVSLSDRSCDPSDMMATEKLEPMVRDQLADWLGETVRSARLLRTYHVPLGLPKLSLDRVLKTIAADGILVCGDHCETPSIQGAMNSGIRVAEGLV